VGAAGRAAVDRAVAVVLADQAVAALADQAVAAGQVARGRVAVALAGRVARDRAVAAGQVDRVADRAVGAAGAAAAWAGVVVMGRSWTPGAC
jgi:hypothetical protein